MKRVILLLGGNQGNRTHYMELARELIGQEIGKIIQSSKIYESTPWGFNADQNFFNQVIVSQSNLAPFNVLEKIWVIEKKLGRIRVEGEYISRTIDIDILFYEHEIIDTPDLTVPHQYMHQRRFTLIPLAEILPDWVHPGLNQPISYLLKNCEDTSEVKALNQ